MVRRSHRRAIRSLAVSRSRTRRALILTVAAALLASGCGPSTPAAPVKSGDASAPLIVFAAASLIDALTEIGGAYEAATGQAVRFSFGASGAVARQIQSGAPADVVLLADSKWMDRLDQAGLIALGSRSDLLNNRLVVIAEADASVAGDPFDWLAATDGKLVIGDPASVPAGAYAKTWMQQTGRWDALQPRLVTASDVRAVRTFVDRGEAGLGVVYFSDTVGDPAIKVVAEPAAADRPAIVYPVGATRTAGPGAARFVAFLKTPRASAVFQAHGFGIAP
ncbi:molybdate ABC transporter substrate-binding protein [soil metagenome]